MEDAPGKTAKPVRLCAVAGGSLFLHLLALLLILFLCRRGAPASFGLPGVPALSLHFAGSAAAAPRATPAEAASAAKAAPILPATTPDPVAAASTVASTAAPASAEISVPPHPEAGSPPESTAAGSQVATAGGGTGPGEAAPGSLSLYGLEGTGRRIAFLFDLSDSIFLRRPGLFDALYAEALAQIDTLPPNVLFDLVVFKNGSLAWRPSPVPATDANRAEARRWLARIAKQGSHFSARAANPGTPFYEGNGTRGDTALRQALGFAPDWIIVLTDGQWETFPQNAKPAPIEAETLLADLRARAESGALPRIDVLLLTSPRTTERESAAARALSEQSGGTLVPLGEEAVEGP